MKTLAPLLLAVVLTGCTTYDSADIELIALDGQAPRSRTVTAGGAATIKIVPDGRSEFSGTEAVTLRALTPGLATFDRTLLADTWTILGVAPGRATFGVYVNQVQIETIVFDVVPFEGMEP